MNKVCLFLAMLLALLICGCTKTIYQEVPVIKTEYITKEKTDSLYMHDSVFIREYIKGDTVRVTEYRWRDRYHYITDIDTVIKTDTIAQPYPVEVIKEVERDLNLWERCFIKLGGFGLFCIFLIIGFIVIKIKHIL